MSKYLYVFLHIPKTAGTTLNFHALKNLSSKEGIDLDRIDPKLNKNLYRKISYNRSTIKKYTDMAVKKTPLDKRKNIKLIYDSHFAYYGIHKHFEKEPRYFTFFRDPTKRTISTYNYLSTLYFLENKAGKRKKLYRSFLLINDKYPSFEDWFENKFDKFNWILLTMPTYKILQSIRLLDSGKATSGSIKKMFKKLYFAGTTETFSDDVLYFYHLLDFNKFFLSQNKSMKYVDPQNANKYKEMVIKKNKTSFDIYDQAKEFNAKFKKQNPEYFEIVEVMKRKRNLSLPFTQVAFDTRGTIGFVSSNLRRTVPYYGEALNFIKHNTGR